MKIKKEIIPMGRPDIRPSEFTAPRLLPRELKNWLDQGKDVILLDTRNEYEIKHGTFEGARTLGLKHFREFGAKLKTVLGELRDKPVVMFCTGGIPGEGDGIGVERKLQRRFISSKAEFSVLRGLRFQSLSRNVFCL